MIKNRPPVHPILAERAKYLRSYMTPEEKHLWYDFLKPVDLNLIGNMCLGIIYLIFIARDSNSS